MSSETKGLYEKYARGAMDRREFLEKLAALAGGTAAAVGVASATCSPVPLPGPNQPYHVQNPPTRTRTSQAAMAI